MPAWKSVEHLRDHYDSHRRQFPGVTIDEYDASAQETMTVGVRFTYRDRITGLPRIGYFHRETARLTALDLEGFIVSHFRTDEEYVAELPRSAYTD